MNNKIETQESNLEINLEDMQPMQDDELKTVTGGAVTATGDDDGGAPNRNCHRHN